MKQSSKQIAEIEGRIYIASRLPREQLSAALSEIVADFKKIVREFEKGRKHHSARAKRCLVVLLTLLDSGHVSIVSIEDREVWEWARKEARKIIETWED